jgi:ribonuclease D
LTPDKAEAKQAIDYSLVADCASLEDLAEQITQAGAVALDTEADSYYHYHSKVCLIQAVLPDGRYFMIDPLACENLAPLAPILASPNITKVLHGAEYDVRILKAAGNFSFAGVFDTLLARRVIGQGPFGLAALALEFFDVVMSKTNQREDWSLRPIPPGMIQYALTDVKYLFELRSILSDKLVAAGRLAWAEEEMRSLCELPAMRETTDPENYWRIKGLSKLADRPRARARELFLLRDQLARKLDRAAFRVLGNDALLGLANGANEASSVRGAGGFLQRYQAEFTEAMDKAKDAPPPVRPRNPRLTSAPDKPQVLDALRQARNTAAAALNLEIGFLCPGSLLEDWAKNKKARQELSGLKGWRREQLADKFLAVVGE